MNWLARLRAWLCETPPEVVREPKVVDLKSRRRRALREGDFEKAEKLKQQISDGRK